MEDRDDYPIIPQPEKKVDFSEYLKLYGTYAEHDQKLGEALKELASLKEVVRELIPIAEHATRSLIFKPHIHNQYDEVIDRAKRISDNK